MKRSHLKGWNRVNRSIVLAFGAVLIAQANQAGAQSRMVPKHTMPTVVAADSVSAVETFQKLTTALHAGDTAAFVSLFAPDAMVMTPRGDLVPFADYRKASLPGIISLMRALTVDRDSLTRVSVSRGTAWVGASSAASGRVDGSFIHVYLESLAVMRKTSDGWRVVMLHSTSR